MKAIPRQSKLQFYLDPLFNLQQHSHGRRTYASILAIVVLTCFLTLYNHFSYACFIKYFCRGTQIHSLCFPVDSDMYVHRSFGIFPFRCFVWIVLESWLISLVLCEGGGFFFALFSSSHKHLFPFNYGFLLINNIHSTPLDSTLISDPDLARPAKFNLMPFVPNYNFYKLIDGRQAGRINIHGFTDFMFGSGSFSSNYV